MFYAPRHVFDGSEGVGSHFHVLRVRTQFRWYRGRPVPFSCFALPDMFLAVQRASGPVFMFSAPGSVFGGTEGVGSRFHVLQSRTSFRRYGGCRVPFSCFTRLDSFSAVPRALGHVFMFCDPGVSISCFAIPDSFWWYRCRPIPFLCFALPDMFLAVQRSSGPVFMFCAPGRLFGGTEGVGSRFHVLRSWTCFRRCRVRRVPFSCVVRLDSFSTVSRATGPVVMFCAPGLVFGSTDGVGSRFHVLRSRTRFRWYGGRRVPFSCFARPDSFSAETRVPGPVFMFCASGVVSRGTEGVGSRFQVLRSRTRF
jgi:hypothetical protein